MEEKVNEGLHSRREFFKKAAKGTLPILGVSLFGLSILNSCDKDEPSNGGSGCKGNCSGNCDSSCSGSCSSSCSGNCDGCTGGCDASACKYM